MCESVRAVAGTKEGVSAWLIASAREVVSYCLSWNEESKVR